MNIMYLSAEVEPYAKTGGLGDVIGALPREVARHEDCKVSVVMPRYTAIIPSNYLDGEMSYVGEYDVKVNWRTQRCKVYTIYKHKINFYFLDNEYYFSGNKVYSDKEVEQFAFFSNACLGLIEFLKLKVDLLHCNDWSTALVPVLLDAYYREKPLFAKIKTLFTIHNMRYQGRITLHEANDLIGLPAEYWTEDQMWHKYGINLMKGALIHADEITTVSPSYAKEIRTSFYGEGLNETIDKNYKKLSGIVNGIDYLRYDPATDTKIYYNYSRENWKEGKRQNKMALQREVGLPVNPDVPLLGIVARLVEQKGVGLIQTAMHYLLQRGMQIIVSGSGEPAVEEMFNYYASKYPDKISAQTVFSDQMAHKVYAGSDLFLVPSMFEPCGLTQIIALKYGSVPIVRETGGLKDTIFSYNEHTGQGNGFSFHQYNTNDMVYTIDRALDFYYNRKGEFDTIVNNGFNCDYSWKESAIKYIDLYKKVCRRRSKTTSGQTTKTTKTSKTTKKA